MFEGVGDLLFFVASVLPVGWGISKVLTFVDERGLSRVSRIHMLSVVTMTSYASPCIRRELLKFKLTNQNSASGKNYAILVLFDVTPIVYIRIG